MVKFTLRLLSFPGRSPWQLVEDAVQKGKHIFCHCVEVGSEAEQANYPKLPTHLVGIATRYGLDGPGIAFRWGARFSAPVQIGPGAHAASYTMGTGSLPGVKQPGRDFDHPTSSCAEVKERIELYLYSPSGPSWPVLG